MGSSILANIAQPYTLYAIAALLAGYVVYTVVYNRFFHPLAKVPGPFLASVTFLYQSYYNGRYYRQIEKLHERYGLVAKP